MSRVKIVILFLSILNLFQFFVHVYWCAKVCHDLDHTEQIVTVKPPNKRPLGGNIQYGVVEGIPTFQELFTE